jgi:methionyl-tRNA formyltransferase
MAPAPLRVADLGAAPLKVAFAGTPPFAAAALKAIVEAGFSVPLVLTQPDRPAGRGLKLQPSAVKEQALSCGSAVAQPRSLKLDGRHPEDAAAARAALQAAAPDVLVVAAYGLILPRWTLDLPRLGCINIHASLLPRWRGAAPIQRAIEAGDAETGITLMQMDEGLDTGPMLLRAALPIGPTDTAGTLTAAMAVLGAGLVVDGLKRLSAGRLPATPQPDTGASYAVKIDKAEGGIDWQRPAAEIERRLRAFDPSPGCHAEIAGASLKLWRGALAGTTDRPAGAAIALGGGRFAIACGDGQALELIEVQRPGGRRLPAQAAGLAVR